MDCPGATKIARKRRPEFRDLAIILGRSGQTIGSGAALHIQQLFWRPAIRCVERISKCPANQGQHDTAANGDGFVRELHHARRIEAQFDGCGLLGRF